MAQTVDRAAVWAGLEPADVGACAYRGRRARGAGGGGFLMFYAEEKRRLRRVMADAGLREVRFRFDFEGTKTVWQ